MQNDRPRLVMLDPDDVRRLRVAVIRPFNVTGNHVLRTLQPLETDHRYRRGFDFTRVDATVRELIDLIASDGRLDLLHARLHGHPNPRIGYVLVELRRIKPLNNFPSFTRKYC